MATGLQLSHAGILQEAIKNGLQSFVLPSKLVATTAAGTPAPGYFYTIINGRASINNLSTDLRASIGSERILFTSADEVFSENGPSKDRIFSIPGEDRIRLIGEWSFSNDYSKGFISRATSASASYPCYMEVVFYGTGLNLLMTIDSSSRAGITCSVDQGSYGPDLFPAGTVNSVISSRNYAPNQVLKVTSGLALGLHTAIIKFTSPQEVYGLEILNQQTSNVTVNPGTAFIDGLKVVSAGGTVNYRNGVTGTKGGRQLVYLKNDGTIGSSFVSTNATSKYLLNTDHSGEDLFRSYSIREFSGAASYDFGKMFALNAAVAYTLSDGATTLSTNGGQISIPNGSYLEGIVPTGANNWISFTFVGTGIDLVNFRPAGSQVMDAHSITVDGVVIGNLPESLVPVTTSIASNLPYGTHVVKITRLTGSNAGCWISSFKVYQPKKPSLPDGCIELADYNVAADYVQNTIAGDSTVSTGVIRKNSLREASYFGSSWVASLTQGSSVSGYTIDSTAGSGTSGASCAFHFWGTGVEVRMYQPASSSTTFAINGSSNFATMANGSGGTGITTGFYGGTGSSVTISTTNASTSVTTASTSSLSAGMSITGAGIPSNSFIVSITNATTFVISSAATATASGITATVMAAFNSSTGVLAGDTTSRGSGVRFSNLPLGLHTITVTKSSNTLLSLESFDVITPVHSTFYDSSYKHTAAPLLTSRSFTDLRKFDLVNQKQSSPTSAGGKVINTWFVRTDAGSRETINAISPVPITGLSLTITPSSVKSRFLITGVVNGSMTYVCSTLIYRNGYNVLPISGNNNNEQGSAAITFYGTTEYAFSDWMSQHVVNYLDAPGTTSTITYDLRHTSGWNGVAKVTYINGRNTSTNADQMSVPSYLMIMELES